MSFSASTFRRNAPTTSRNFSVSSTWGRWLEFGNNTHSLRAMQTTRDSRRQHWFRTATLWLIFACTKARKDVNVLSNINYITENMIIHTTASCIPPHLSPSSNLSKSMPSSRWHILIVYMYCICIYVFIHLLQLLLPHVSVYLCIHTLLLVFI